MSRFKMMVQGFPDIYFKVSKNPLKKYDAYDRKTNKKISSFGSRLHEQFFDKIGAFSSKNHFDKARRKRYYLRHGKSAPKYSAKWFSHNFLW